MIIYPENWEKIGQPIQIKDIEKVILQTLSRIGCPFLSFSGGLDSSLMLYFMAKIFPKVFCLTIGFPENHPDVEYSRLVVKEFKNVKHVIYIPTQKEIAKEGRNPRQDLPVKLFYEFLTRKKMPEIIACDGIDEFLCGYYDHQHHPNEKTYYNFLRRLSKEHLKPLNKNSGDIDVYLPFLSKELLYLLAQIPVSEKVDRHNRKKIMVKMARGKIPDKVIERWKYGFCDALRIKEVKNED